MKKNNIWKIVLIIFLILGGSCFAAKNKQDNPETDFIYHISDKKTIVIDDYTGTNTEARIPARIQRLPVGEISDRAFYEKKLTAVIIPDSVTGIGDFAFCNNRLTSVVIPKSVTRIGIGAFQGNSRLDSLILPDNLARETGVTNFLSSFYTVAINVINVTSEDGMTHIKRIPFKDDMIEDIVLPDGITHIGEYVFTRNWVTKLTGVTLPDSLTYIGEHAFEGNLLKAVTIPENVTYIGIAAFHENQLTDISLPSGLKHIQGSAFCNNLIAKVTIPETVTRIDYLAFSNNMLAEIIIPANVTEICSQAFSGNRLTSIVIPPGVRDIGYWAFKDNPLASITIGADVRLGHSSREDGYMAAFSYEFDSFYKINGSKAARYILSHGRWIIAD